MNKLLLLISAFLCVQVYAAEDVRSVQDLAGLQELVRFYVEYIDEYQQDMGISNINQVYAILHNMVYEINDLGADGVYEQLRALLLAHADDPVRFVQEDMTFGQMIEPLVEKARKEKEKAEQPSAREQGYLLKAGRAPDIYRTLQNN